MEENEMNIQSDANVATLFLDIGYSAYVNSDKVHKENFYPIFVWISYYPQRIFYQILPQKVLKGAAERIYTDFLKDKSSLKKVIKEHYNLQKEADKYWEDFQKNRTTLKTAFKKISKVFYKSFQYAAVGEDKGELIELKIIPEFARRNSISLAEARKVISILSHPPKQSLLSLERKYYLDICKAFLQGMDCKKELEEYIKRYYWFKTNFYSHKDITENSLIEEIKKEIKEAGKESILKEARDFDVKFKSINKEKELLLKKTKLSNRDKKDIEFARLIIEWTDIRKVQMLKIGHYSFFILKEIVNQKKLEYDDMAILTFKEASDFIDKNIKLNKNIAERRRAGFFTAYDKSGHSFFYGADAKELLNAALKFEKKEIKGQVASTGGADDIEGRVRIVLNPNEKDINKGEILVTSMTRTDSIPLMRKAKAIITDEGGIACHAAIVSRELGIPCIIGTKVATKLLKDGDTVRMDLEKGTVIIKK